MEQALTVRHYGLIGAGRLATHLAHYFRLLDVSFSQWSRPAGPTASFDEMAAQAWDALPSSDVLLLAVSDRAIAPLAAALRTAAPARPVILVHFSGGSTVPGMESAHPLMSFGPELYTRDEYERIPFVTAAGARPFRELFPALPNPNFTLREDQKPLYHALCVLGGNLSSILWSKALGDFEQRLGLPAHVLHPYLRRIMENTLQAPTTALTGPLARRDMETIQANLDTLEGDPYREVYAAFVAAFLGDPPEV